MRVPIGIPSPRGTARTDEATLPSLLNTLSLFAVLSCIGVLAFRIVTASDMPYEDEFLYGRGLECAVALAFLVVSALSWGLFLGALTQEPVMLPAWEQSSRMMVVLWMFLLRILRAVVRRVDPLGAALLIGASHPYRDPGEPTGLRLVATPDASPRFTHRWVAGISPQIIYH